MDKTDPLHFFSIPEQFQATALREYVRSMIAAGNRAQARSFYDTLFSAQGHEYTKAVLGHLCMNASLDDGDVGTALILYRQLESLGTADAIVCIRAKALVRLVPCLLPDNLSTALALWEQLSTHELPLEALWAWTKSGLEILKVALDRHDMDTQKRLYRYLYPESDLC